VCAAAPHQRYVYVCCCCVVCCSLLCYIHEVLQSQKNDVAIAIVTCTAAHLRVCDASTCYKLCTILYYSQSNAIYSLTLALLDESVTGAAVVVAVVVSSTSLAPSLLSAPIAVAAVVVPVISVALAVSVVGC
jgi:uncharacterized membrane protein